MSAFDDDDANSFSDSDVDDDNSFSDSGVDDDNSFNYDDGDIVDIEINDDCEYNGQHNLPFVYLIPSHWKLALREQVLKNAKLIITYTLNVLSENDKGPITSSEQDDVERIIYLALEVVGRAYDIYKQKVGEEVALFPMSSSHSKESGVYFLQLLNADGKVG
jgi:hypothetical protein